MAHQKTRVSGRSFASMLFFGFGIASAISIAIAIFDPQEFFSTALAWPGRNLVEVLGFVAWWIPVYFLILGAQILRPRLITWTNVIVLSAVHVPMLTIATLIQLGTGGSNAPLVLGLIAAFTLRGGILVVSLVLALESIALYQLWLFLSRRSIPTVSKDEDVSDSIARLPILLPAPEWTPHDIEAETDAIDDILDRAPEHGDRDDIEVITIEELRQKMEPEIEVADVEPSESLEPLHLMLRSRRPRTIPTQEIEYEADEEELEDRYEEDEPDLEEFSPPPSRSSSRSTYEIPIDGVLLEYADGRYWEIDDETRDAAEVLRTTLEEFGIKAEVTGIRKGPVITMFEILPAPGVKLEKISNLANNIALRLAASSVRIVAPIPGKHAVGIEIPNRERNIVSFAELLRVDEFSDEKIKIPIALGKDIAGEAQVVDLTGMPHVLIAGATGSGKSVCVNSIICSILYRRSPADVKLILIDPKIVELKFYNDIPHLLTPVITDPKRAFQALQYLIYEMERRYSLLDSLGVRDIGSYNAKVRRKRLATEPIPYIVVIIDEFADLMATSGKELESTVARLAAMSRAVGIHLILATQRPSTDVITGLIKANIPSRIAFMVASKVDSRIIIDAMGAEKLLGRGDMLFTSAADPFPIRMQGAYLTEEEVERVVVHVKEYGEPEYIDEEIFIEEDDDDLAGEYLEDPLMEKAIEIVTNSNKASASYLQRRLKVGYNRAARMVEEMERLGIVGPQNGSKPREVIGRVSGSI